MAIIEQAALWEIQHHVLCFYHQILKLEEHWNIIQKVPRASGGDEVEDRHGALSVFSEQNLNFSTNLPGLSACRPIK